MKNDGNGPCDEQQPSDSRSNYVKSLESERDGLRERVKELEGEVKMLRGVQCA
jgi:hypothetical protein